MIIRCHVCIREFETFPSRQRKNKGQFCSRKCYAKELSKRMSGANHPLYGKHHTAESLVKMRAIKREHAKRFLGELNPRYKGHWMHRGYRFVHVVSLPTEQQAMARKMLPKGKRGIAEHRLMMAMILGRPLTRSEVVHHRNGVKDDNRPENLEAMDNCTHKREHKEILAELRALRLENEQLKSLLATCRCRG